MPRKHISTNIKARRIVRKIVALGKKYGYSEYIHPDRGEVYMSLKKSDIWYEITTYGKRYVKKWVVRDEDDRKIFSCKDSDLILSLVECIIKQ